VLACARCLVYLLPPAPYFNQQTNANHEVKSFF
jgi:hypothetical protein